MTREEYLFHQRLRVVDYILNEKVKKIINKKVYTILRLNLELSEVEHTYFRISSASYLYYKNGATIYKKNKNAEQYELLRSSVPGPITPITRFCCDLFIILVRSIFQLSPVLCNLEIYR